MDSYELNRAQFHGGHRNLESVELASSLINFMKLPKQQRATAPVISSINFIKAPKTAAVLGGHKNYHNCTRYNETC